MNKTSNIKKTSVKKNYILNTFYQILSIITPLITTPYISRVIGAAGIGKFSYTNSIVSYLVLFGSLGLTAYASRQMAFMQNDREAQTRFFNEVMTLKVFLIIPEIIILIVMVFSSENYRWLFLVEGLYLVDAVLNIDWLYVGNENFLATVIRSICVKIASVICIFLFVKKEEDLLIYVLILCASNLTGAIMLWLGISKYIDRLYISYNGITNHLKGGISIFLIQISWSMYTYLDKVMIGLLQTDINQNGYYEQSQKIIVLSTTIVSSLSTVMLPRISNAFINNQKSEINRYMNGTMKFAICIGMALTVGLIACSDNIVPWFFGSQFMECISLLKILAPIILFSSLYNILGYQYLLGTKQEKLMTLSIIVGAFVNVLLNVIMIPKTGAYGASVASLIAEIIIVLIQFVFVSKQVSFLDLRIYIFKCFIACLVMYLMLTSVSRNISSGILQTWIMIASGAIIYFLSLMIVRENFLTKVITEKLFRRCK